MSCFDELIESIEYPTILIIYDDQYQIAKKYENDTIKCIPKQEIYHFEQSYQYVILCCEDVPWLEPGVTGFPGGSCKGCPSSS